MSWLVGMVDYEKTMRDKNSKLDITAWNYWLEEISTSEGNTSELADGMLKFFKYSFSPRCSDLFLPSIPRGRFQPENPPCKKFIILSDVRARGTNNGLI